MRKEESRVLNMSNGHPMSLLLRFALPLFLANVLQQFYNAADTALAGHIIGETALSEIGATSALYGLIINFAFGLNNGFALSLSRSFGSNDEKAMKKALSWMIVLSALFAVLITAFFLILRSPILSLMQVPLSIMDGSLSYLTVILSGIPFTMAYNFESSMLQALGNSLTPLLLLLFSTILNIVLDIVFMGPLGLGVKGAALATVLAQAIASFIGLFYILRSYKWLKLRKEDFVVEKGYVRRMTLQGLGMAFMSALYNLGSVILQSSINALGEIYIAAQVASRRIAEFIFTPGVALGSAIATFTSQNYGSGKKERIKSGVASAIALYLIWWVFALVFLFTLVRPTIALITGSNNVDVINNASLYLHVSIPLIPPMAVLVILRNAHQGIGRPLLPLITSALELVTKAIFAVFIVPSFGYRAVCIAEPTAWIICFAVMLTGTLFMRKELFGKK